MRLFVNRGKFFSPECYFIFLVLLKFSKLNISNFYKKQYPNITFKMANRY